MYQRMSAEEFLEMQKHPEPALRVLVPPDFMGASSSTSSSIQDDEWLRPGHPSGASLQGDDRQRASRSCNLRVLEIKGTEISRARQCSRIVDLLKKRAENRGGEALGLKVIIPEDKVWPLTNIKLKLLMRKTRTKIIVSGPMNVDRPVLERVFTITGNSENVVRAIQSISDVLRENSIMETMT